MIAAAVLVILVAACGSDASTTGAGQTTTVVSTTDPSTTNSSTTNPPAAGPMEYTVFVDGRVDEFNGAFFAYFPDTITVHPGDTIVYKSVFSGEPHSVTFGSVVETAIDEFRKLTPEQLQSEGPPPPELEAAFGAIPAMLPDGPGDANQNSVNPCFVSEGEAVPDDVSTQCPVTEPSAFTGTETFYNSGFLPDGEIFSMEIAEDIAPGTYLAFCTLHFTEMISEVTVVPADEPVPTPDEVAALAQEQLDKFVDEMLPTVDAAKAAATPGKVLAGLGSEAVPAVLDVDFIPADATAAAGEAVTWSIVGPHTVSFNPPESARTILVKGEDDGYHLVEEAVAPAGYEPPPPSEGEGDGPPPPVDGGTWDGTGFFSSGIMFGGDFTLAITSPGTYDYICLIHPEMQGTVTIE